MTDQSKDILQYVGDDGEFRVSIDKYAEDILAGDFADCADGYDYDSTFDLLDYRYRFHGLPWQRWRQYVEYHTLIHQLPYEAVTELSEFARFTRSLSSPYSLFKGLFFYFILPFLIMFILAVISVITQ